MNIINTLSSLPAVISGPLLRHLDQHHVTIWLVTTSPFQLSAQLYDRQFAPLYQQALTSDELQTIKVGEHAYIQLITLELAQALPEQQLIYYDLTFSDATQSQQLSELVPELLYKEQRLPSFVINNKVDTMLHGSCRKPHFDSGDGLVQVDDLLANDRFSAEQRPAMLMMSGDQIYADDVAGPTLVAIHQVIELLGLYDEQWQGALVNNSDALYRSTLCYYQRDQLLPHTKANQAVYDKFFAASKKPIFTSVNAKNHLVTFAETIAMYFLVWSPELWQLVDLSGDNIAADYQAQYQNERRIINEFVTGLAQVRRALAHLPNYMIFDDHDITDDWNLTRGWEEAAYGHPFSKRIIGNALAAYWLCQGWGNAPEKFAPLQQQAKQWFTEQGLAQQDQMIEQLFAWQQWHYSLASSPKIVVLDTRTQRWRSESRSSKPSGLMDWEALTEMQQQLIDEPRVILISPAPIYGVKLIETIQRIFTFFGYPLMVDAENWMAHPGTANVMLNIFRHVKTPPEFIILSGDVHYSFVYDVSHRFRRSNSHIVQVTSSGIKNQFPKGLLSCLDKLNRFLYAPYSPLNWFTKRRHMKIDVRKPLANQSTELYNASGIGLITLTKDDTLVNASILTVDGEIIDFQQAKEKQA